MLREAIFVPPGYSNLLLARDEVFHDCDSETDLLRDFRSYILSLLHIKPSVPLGVECVVNHSVRRVGALSDCDGGDDTNRDVVTLIVRRPYQKFVDHKFMGRMIANEQQLLLELQRALGSDVLVVMVDLAPLAFTDQLALMARTDLLIGMHGAGLAHGLFLPQHAGVFLPTYKVSM